MASRRNFDKFDVYTVHHLKVCIQTNTLHKILVIRLYFPLNNLHVSDCISPSSGATFYKLYIVFGICQYDVQLTNVAPEDGLIYSETCRAFNSISVLPVQSGLPTFQLNISLHVW